MNYPTTRAAAKAAGASHYNTGKACLEGHIDLRRANNGACVACDREREKRRWQNNRTGLRAKQKRWQAANPDYQKNRRTKRLEDAAGRPRAATCECCGKEPEGHRALAFDHCHDSGEFRGWLCDNCNTGLGKLGDTIEGVKLALAYLKRAAKGQK